MTTDKLVPVSEERLREIVTDADNFYRDEIKSMARECLSHRTPASTGEVEHTHRCPICDVPFKADDMCVCQNVPDAVTQREWGLRANDRLDWGRVMPLDPVEKRARDLHRELGNAQRQILQSTAHRYGDLQYGHPTAATTNEPMTALDQHALGAAEFVRARSLTGDT